VSERGPESGFPDIIYMGMNPWHTIRQRAQHLAAGLAEHGRLLFVDPITPSLLGALRCALAGEQRRTWLPRLDRLADNLYHLSPPPGVPFGLDWGICNQVNQRAQTLLVRRAGRRIGIRRPVLWLDHPLEAAQIGRHGERLVVYSCMDNYPAFWLERPLRRRLVATLEQDVLQRADLVLASSGGLLRRCVSASDIRHVPNACDAKLFSQARGSAWPKALEGMRRPLLGYVGTVSHWVDLDLLVELAAAYPQAWIVIVGPVENVDIRPYGGLPNLRFLGPVAYEEVPAFVNAFDVCLIPFKANDLTADVDPVKAYEYLALGKPVVSVGLPELVRYGDLIYTARSKDEASQALAAALEEVMDGDYPALVRARQQIAFENTWEARVATVAALIRERVATPRIHGED
jgi:glycosyltransferase involved in cell wall biosynthesis